MPATRSGRRRSAAMSVIERAEVFVASTHSSRTTCLELCETCFFTSSSSNTASSTRSQSRSRRSPSCRDERGEERPCPRRSGPWRPGRSPPGCRPASSTISCHVADHDRHLQAAQRTASAIWRAIRPAPTMPTCSNLCGAARRTCRVLLRALLDELERVERRLRLRRRGGARRSLPPRARSPPRPSSAARLRSGRARRTARARRRAPCRRPPSRARRKIVSASDQSGSGRSSGCSASSRAKASDSSTNSAGSSSRSAMPSSATCGAVSMRFCRSGFDDDHLDRGLRPDEPREKLRAAPRGEEPEEDLRETRSGARRSRSFAPCSATRARLRRRGRRR